MYSGQSSPTTGRLNCLPPGLWNRMSRGPPMCGTPRSVLRVADEVGEVRIATGGPGQDRDALAGAALPVDIRRVGSGRTRRRGSSCALAVHGDPRPLPQLSAQQAADFLHRPRACSQASPHIRRLRRPDPHRTRSAGASQATSRAPRTDGARVASALAAHECSSCAREYSAADLAETSSLSRMGSESSTEVRSRPL